MSNYEKRMMNILNIHHAKTTLHPASAFVGASGPEVSRPFEQHKFCKICTRNWDP